MDHAPLPTPPHTLQDAPDPQVERPYRFFSRAYKILFFFIILYTTLSLSFPDAVLKITQNLHEKVGGGLLISMLFSLACAAILKRRRFRTLTQRQWHNLAQDLDISISEGETRFDIPTLSGDFDNTHLTISSKTSNEHDQNTTTYSLQITAHNPLPTPFYIIPRKALHTFTHDPTSHFTHNTGDATFDHHLTLHSEHPEDILPLFSSDVRSEILELFALAPELRIDQNGLSLSQDVPFTSRPRLHALLDRSKNVIHALHRATAQHMEETVKAQAQTTSYSPYPAQ